MICSSFHLFIFAMDFDLPLTFFLLESSTLNTLFSLDRRYDVHPLNKDQQCKGEFKNLYQDLRKHPIKFFEYMRMSIETFDMILSRIEHKVEKMKTNFKRPLSPLERLMITLRHLSTGMSFRQLHFSFCRGKSTIAFVVYEVCSAILEELENDYMPVPTTADFKKIATDYFNRWKFPNCIGSIDGRHYRIKNFEHCGSTHFNYMKYFSIVLQGVADANKKFITIDVGARGKQHDASTFRQSKLYRLLEKSRFNVPAKSKLPTTNIDAPFVLIGDEAYPLTRFLMRPYPKKQLTPEKERYNTRLSTARKCIECAFGILRAKWRFLSKEIETDKNHARLMIKAACLLHNIIRDRDGETDADYLNTLPQIYDNSSENHADADTSNNSGPFARIQRDRANNSKGTQAKVIRDNFTRYFQNW